MKKTIFSIFGFISLLAGLVAASLAIFALVPCGTHPAHVAGVPVLMGMAGGVITSGNFARALWPGVFEWFGMKYDEWSPEFDRIFKVETSKKAYELLSGTVFTGLAKVKAEGDSVAYDSMQAGIETKSVHSTYALGFIITREAHEDNLYPELVKSFSSALAFSLRQTKETVAANCYNRAFTGGTGGTQQLTGDGQPWLSAAHVNKSGGTFSNVMATAADMSEAALEQACIDIANFTTDRGLKINIKPETIILPQNLAFEAHRIVKSVQQNDTANNATNALRDMGMFPGGIVASHYFTDTNNWFIRTNCPDSMIFFQRRAMTLESPGENDFNTDNAKFKATERYSANMGDPRGLYGSAPAGG